MTRRRELEQHRHTLDETREILGSMKTLAYMETRKLEHRLEGQRALSSRIEEVAADFLGFYPETLPQPLGLENVYLLLGSERGFCGDFNQTVQLQWETIVRETRTGASRAIATGRKLCSLLETDARVVAFIEGASVAEEIDTTLGAVIRAMDDLGRRRGALALTVVYHDADREQVVMTDVLPPFAQHKTGSPGFSTPPLLNLPPQVFIEEVISHYLFARLHETLHVSLMAENLRRVQHLEGALQHLERRSSELKRRCNTLRQEEIIEEIEVILLSTPGVDIHDQDNPRRN